MWQMMNAIETTAEELLGPLNEVERKYAPSCLYVCGDLNLLRHTQRVAIVGSRKASPNGLARAKKLASLLADRGIVVVSGLAEGIDTAAHTACMQKGGRTVAVIGTPLDKTYPARNTALQEKIMADHLCISQFPPGTPIQRHNFPMRNRTMALISDITVIIEAGESSGSLSQGWEALRLGRGLFIAKSVVDDPSLKWPQDMLEYGAKVLSDSTLDDFFDELPEKMAKVELDGLPF